MLFPGDGIQLHKMPPDLYPADLRQRHEHAVLATVQPIHLAVLRINPRPHGYKLVVFMSLR
jgi:hypothetical protein